MNNPWQQLVIDILQTELSTKEIRNLKRLVIATHHKFTPENVSKLCKKTWQGKTRLGTLSQSLVFDVYAHLESYGAV